jgi:hypothetical protein
VVGLTDLLACGAQPNNTPVVITATTVKVKRMKKVPVEA